MEVFRSLFFIILLLEIRYINCQSNSQYCASYWSCFTSRLARISQVVYDVGKKVTVAIVDTVTVVGSTVVDVSSTVVYKVSNALYLTDTSNPYGAGTFGSTVNIQNEREQIASAIDTKEKNVKMQETVLPFCTLCKIELGKDKLGNPQYGDKCKCVRLLKGSSYICRPCDEHKGTTKPKPIPAPVPIATTMSMSTRISMPILKPTPTLPTSPTPTSNPTSTLTLTQLPAPTVTLTSSPSSNVNPAVTVTLSPSRTRTPPLALIPPPSVPAPTLNLIPLSIPAPNQNQINNINGKLPKPASFINTIERITPKPITDVSNTRIIESGKSSSKKCKNGNKERPCNNNSENEFTVKTPSLIASSRPMYFDNKGNDLLNKKANRFSSLFESISNQIANKTISPSNLFKFKSFG